MRAGQWLEAHRIGGGGFSNEIQDWLGIYSRSNQLRDGCLRHRVGPHVGRSSVPLPELAASLLIAADIKNAAAPRAADQKNRTAAHTAICTRLTRHTISRTSGLRNDSGDHSTADQPSLTTTALRPRDTLRHIRPAPEAALRNRRAIEPVLGNLVAAREVLQSQLRAPGVAVVPAPLRVASTRCWLVHGPSLRRGD